MHYHDECATENNTPADALAEYKKQKYTADNTSYCHIHCLAKKIGIFDDEHGIVVDNWVHQVAAASHKEEDEVRPKIVTCAEEIDQFKADHCLWAFKGYMCTKTAGYEVIDRKEHHKNKKTSKKHE